MTFNSALTLDIPFAQAVLDYLIAHPDEHEQTYFGGKTKCGTKACIAGTAVILDAATKVHWNRCSGMEHYVHVGKRQMDIAERAAELLGLNGADASHLFYDWNNTAALERLTSYIKAAEAAQGSVLAGLESQAEPAQVGVS